MSVQQPAFVDFRKSVGTGAWLPQNAGELDDTLPLAYARLAWAYFATRQHAKAIPAARRGVTPGPNDAKANVQLGNILNWAGKPEEGKQYIERAIRLSPHHPYYYLFYLGQSYYLAGENAKAIGTINYLLLFCRCPCFAVTIPEPGGC